MLAENLKIARDKKGLLLMTHMVLGFPSFDDNWKMLEVMEEVGADVVELQFPFSEPVADGPLFVMANQASLEAGTTVDQCYDFMKRASARFSMPLLMMGYYNTVFSQGEERFCSRLADSGGVGSIIPDLPLDYASDYIKESASRDLATVQIVTPNSSVERRQQLATHSTGLVYCVARKGVTGKDTAFDENLKSYIASVKAATDLVVAVGFGVKSHADIRALEGIADMAIIGTAGLQAWMDGGESHLKSLLDWRAA
jgi:tryptophan synthase alpha chain